MSKGKTVAFAFPSARQPTTDDWVSGATETQKPGGSETRKSGGKLARLSIDLPEELHGQFKAACAKQRTKMRDEVLTFIEQRTKKRYTEIRKEDRNTDFIPGPLDVLAG
jgi:hypothetical protein